MLLAESRFWLNLDEIHYGAERAQRSELLPSCLPEGLHCCSHRAEQCVASPVKTLAFLHNTWPSCQNSLLRL